MVLALGLPQLDIAHGDYAYGFRVLNLGPGTFCSRKQIEDAKIGEGRCLFYLEHISFRGKGSLPARLVIQS